VDLNSSSRWFWRLLFVLTLALLSSPARGQTSTPPAAFPITPGNAFEGHINNTLFSVRYSFDAQAGDSLTIRMDATSGDLDPYLLLFSPSGDAGRRRHRQRRPQCPDRPGRAPERKVCRGAALPAGITRRAARTVCGWTSRSGGRLADRCQSVDLRGVSHIDYQDFRADTWRQRKRYLPPARRSGARHHDPHRRRSRPAGDAL
jgi:hypothetical protein